MGRLTGKVALITGAARGQGRCHAVRLAEEGADIVAIDICRPVASVPYNTATSPDLVETTRQVKVLGQRIIAAEADVRDLVTLEAVAQQAVDEFGRLDIVVANAGISSAAPVLQMSDETWTEMIDVNLTGAWRTLKAAAPYIVAGGRGGAIVITSSTAAIRTNPNLAHYTAAKTGLVGLMRVAAKELAGHAIRVNTLHPGTVATEMVLNEAGYRWLCPGLENPTREDFEAAARTHNPLPVAAIDPDDLASAVLYLVSDEGRYITGTTHVVGAGNTL